MIASPWDIIQTGEGEFVIAMAGTHQIWALDTKKDICYRLSGSGAEANTNSSHESSAWAQPSGITFGQWNGNPQYFIAVNSLMQIITTGIGF